MDRTPPADGPTTTDRREFLKTAGAAAGAGAGLLLLGACAAEARPLPGMHRSRRVPLLGHSPDVVVVGAGLWGGFTALQLRQQGARVTLVDAYGPGNSRSTSGDETRGVRSSYGDRERGGETWVLWARESMRRWKQFDAEWGRELKLKLFHTTGDLIFREEWEPFTSQTRQWWAKHNIPYEVLKPDEVRYRWPVIDVQDVNVVLAEPDAGVVRARRSAQAVAAVFEQMGGTVITGRAALPRPTNGRLEELVLDTGQRLRADTFVFAVGPWLGKTFPDVMANRTRVPMGYVCYYGTPMNDERFTYPNIPSFNFPGVTGWAALPADSRGFRVRGSVRAPTPPAVPGAPPPKPAPRPPTPPAQLDPDTSDRWPDATRLEGTRRFVAQRFPLLAEAPLLATHACHYESTSSNNFVIDRHPHMSNVWIAAGGNAEGAKFAPVVSEYIAQRALGVEGDPAVAREFRIPEKEYDPPPPPVPVVATTPGGSAKATAR